MTHFTKSTANGYLTGFINFTNLKKAKAKKKLQPAFYDMETDTIYPSTYADGRAAPIHIYDGLPNEVQVRMQLNIVSGFTMNGDFLTRNQAMTVTLNA